MGNSKAIWIKRLKKNMQCFYCGERMGLTFHHLNPSTKVKCISYMVYKPGYNKKQIIEEMKKCRVACIRCHIGIHKEINLFIRLKQKWEYWKYN